MEQTTALYHAMLAEDRHEHPDAFDYVTGQLFHGVRLDGAHALEIGSGRGLQAIYMAQRGAIVTSMEPEGVGSTAGVIAKQRDRCARLGLHNVDVINADFNTWQTDRTFNVILSRASINHLYPSDKHALWHPPTRDGYTAMLRRVHHLLAPGGVFIATDACRYAFFTMARDFGIKRPWEKKRTGVDWRHHQNPRTWRRLLHDAGFNRIEVDYPVQYSLRHVPLVNTAVANFFLKGAFIIRAHR
jgi:SAM-dependent methyltransferase